MGPPFFILSFQLFGSLSGDEEKDEEDLMNSPKADPVDQQNPEPIEVDAIEFKLHPSKAEQLNADAERIIFNKN